ncbi:MAG: triose-phosphate isomerase [Bacteroidia bacterium]|nr:triose-phosphate isomerase [Bacteroidia bacterium]
MRSMIVAGNWKMNKNATETTELIGAISNGMGDTSTKVMVAPPFVNLAAAADSAKNTNIIVAAQNMHFAESGAFTGEVSASMLLHLGIDHVILGHSERRALFGEWDALLAKKADTALDKNMTVIFCFGEELHDRKNDIHFDVVKNQLSEGLFHLEANNWQNIILAYEPVWAIGTGETASPEQAQEMHAFIRKTLIERYDPDLADGVSILYGGSVKPGNARDIFSKPDVDGGLIGGASLNADDFLAIVQSA